MAKIEEYRAHRLAREAQVLDEVGRGAGTAAELTRRVYGPLDEQLLVAAEMTMRAHLRKLVDDGAVRSSGAGDRELFDARGMNAGKARLTYHAASHVACFP